jgi:hypothetical protein
MAFWANFLGYQLVWFIAVSSAGRSSSAPGICAGILFVASQLATSRRWLPELRLLAVALACGVIIDGTLAASGLLQYAAEEPALPPGGAPAWILTLWVSFATTLTRSLRWLEGRIGIAALVGAVGGPLAYLGAARGWNAVIFPAPAWHAEACLAAGWAAALALLVRLAALPRADAVMVS